MPQDRNRFDDLPASLQPLIADRSAGRRVLSRVAAVVRFEQDQAERAAFLKEVIRTNGTPRDASARNQGNPAVLNARMGALRTAASVTTLGAGVEFVVAGNAATNSLKRDLAFVGAGIEVASLGLGAAWLLFSRQARDAKTYVAGWASHENSTRRAEKEALQAVAAYEMWLDSHPGAPGYEEVKADFAALPADVAEQLVPARGLVS